MLGALQHMRKSFGRMREPLWHEREAFRHVPKSSRGLR